MKILGVDFVMLPVSDLERAARFYRQTLGLRQELLNTTFQWAEFDGGNVTIALKGGAVDPHPAVGGRSRVALAVDDVEEACAELSRKGVTIVNGPTDYQVCWSAEIHDPDGNAVLLHHRADNTYGTA
ncbi:MAG: VOC family protein [Opitutaceae bacterium]|nr:VOC family protein [Opitutaceae bacterium]